MRNVEVKKISVSQCPHCDNCMECEYFCGISVVPDYDDTKLVVKCGNPVQKNIY